MTPAQQYLAWIERLGGEATKGEWTRDPGYMSEPALVLVGEDVVAKVGVDHRGTPDAALIVALHNSRDAVGRVIRAAIPLCAMLKTAAEMGDERAIEFRAALNDLPVEAQHPTGDTE